jgi:hypothetical protein
VEQWYHYDEFGDWVYSGTNYTNQIVVYTNIVVTNQFDTFVYSWATPDATGTSTAYPPIRTSWFTAWDSKLEDLFAGSYGIKWVDCEAFGVDTNDYGDAWYEANTNELQYPPVYAEDVHGTITATFLKKAGIGGAFSNSPSSWGNKFTHKPNLLTNTWVLGVIAHSTNGWRYDKMVDLSASVYDQSVRPVLQYVPSGANPFSESITFSVDTATRLKGNTEATEACTETIIAASSALVAFTNRLASVSSMSASTNPPDALIYRSKPK